MIDDISIDVGECDEPISCRFDDFCSWKENSAKDNKLWSIGPGRVAHASKLNTKQLVNLYSRDNLYTDFTSLSGSDSLTMELMSEFVDAPKDGACVELRYLVASISLDTDSFQLDQIDIDGMFCLCA